MGSKKEYMVSLDIWHPRLTLTELERELGAEGDQHSHSLGDRRSGGRTFTSSVWRLSSDLPDECELEQHLSRLRTEAVRMGLLGREALPDGAEPVLNVGVRYSTAYCTVNMPSGWLKPFVDAGFRLSVATYPVDEKQGS